MIFTLERRQAPRNLPVGEATYIDDVGADFLDTLPMQHPPLNVTPAIPGLDVIEIFTDD